MDKEPKQLMIPANKALDYFWLRYGFNLAHPGIWSLAILLMLELQKSFRLDASIIHKIFVSIFLCVVVCVGLRLAFVHKNRLKEFNEEESVKAFEENRLSEEIDPQETAMTFLFTFWLWLLLFIQLLGGIKYID